MPIPATNLTPLGEFIKQTGFAVSFVIEKSGLSRNRLVHLRTNNNAVMSFWEGRALAPVFKMTMEEFAEELKRIEADRAKSGESSAG